MVAQPASRLEERTSRGPSRHTLVWTNATLVWPNNDMVDVCAAQGGLGNGTNSQFASPRILLSRGKFAARQEPSPGNKPTR